MSTRSRRELRIFCCPIILFEECCLQERKAALGLMYNWEEDWEKEERLAQESEHRGRRQETGGREKSLLMGEGRWKDDGME